VIMLVLTSQMIQMRFFLWPLTQSVFEQFVPILRNLIMSLLEMILPLTYLIAISVLIQSLKSSGWIESFKGYGFSYEQLILIPVFCASICSAMTLYCALYLTPFYLQQMRISLIDILQDRFEQQDFVLSSVDLGSDLGSDLGKGKAILYTGIDDQRYLFLLFEDLKTGLSHGYLKAQVKQIELQPDENQLKVNLEAVEMQEDQRLKIKIKTLQLAFKQDFKFKIFSLPNAGFQSQLDRSNPHHHFIFHKRYAQSALAFLWMILGIITAAQTFFSPFKQTILLCLMILSTYGLMRHLELLCRQNLFSPIYAAWIPLILPILAIVWVARTKQKF
jgi:lipopolysaccharide export LptBFGC system permease protein LptF